MQYVVRSSRAIRGCRADMATTPSSSETYLKLATPQELRNHSSISRNWRREKQLANKRAVAGVITEWSKVRCFSEACTNTGLFCCMMLTLQSSSVVKGHSALFTLFNFGLLRAIF